MAAGRINGVAALKGFVIRKCMAFSPGQNKVAVLTLSRSGFFSIFWTGGGGGLRKPPLSNSENIKATVMKL